MKILITGITGLLGSVIGKCLSYSGEYCIYALGRNEFFFPNITYIKMDLKNLANLKEYLQHIQPDIIIHCAAATDMDLCERDFAYAELINVKVTEVLAKYGARMIYISSDGVFDGLNGNYTESDIVSPVNIYGQTKWRGEQVISMYNANSVVLRVSMYGFKLNGKLSWAQWAAKNIVQGIPIKGLIDVKNNPLYTSQIVEVIKKLLMEKYTGILNLGCNEIVSRYQFFIKLARLLKKDESIIYPTMLNELNFKENRSKNTSLNVKKLKTMGIEFNLDAGILAFYNDYIKWLN